MVMHRKNIVTEKENEKLVYENIFAYEFIASTCNVKFKNRL